MRIQTSMCRSVALGKAGQHSPGWRWDELAIITCFYLSFPIKIYLLEKRSMGICLLVSLILCDILAFVDF